jgi:hypothetical protein
LSITVFSVLVVNLTHAQKINYNNNEQLCGSSEVLHISKDVNVGTNEMMLQDLHQIGIVWNNAWFYPPIATRNGVQYYGGVGGDVFRFGPGYIGDGSSPPQNYSQWVRCSNIYYGPDQFDFIDTFMVPETGSFIPMGNIIVTAYGTADGICFNNEPNSVTTNPGPGGLGPGYNYKFDNCEVYNEVPFVNLNPNNNYQWKINGVVQNFPSSWNGDDLVFNSVDFDKVIPGGQDYLEESWELLENGSVIRSGKHRFYPGPTTQAICSNTSVTLNNNGDASIVVTDINNGSTGCDLTYALSQTNFDCSDIPSTTVTLTVTDSQGNSDNCISTVTVVDNTPPVLTCPEDFSVNTEPGTCEGYADDYTYGLDDNCLSYGLFTLVDTPSKNTPLPIGINTITLVVTDGSQNESSCSFNVTVVDNEDPEAVCNPITANINSDGIVDLGVSDIIAIASGSSDNCTSILTYSLSMNFSTVLMLG